MKPSRYHTFLIPLLLVALVGLITSAAELEEEDLCIGHSCYPATGNLLIGRKNQITATSTCGLKQRDRFCIVSNLDGNTSCYYCDSRKDWKPYPDSSRLSHKIQNIVTENQLDRTRNWWQSENGVQNVSIRLDLEAEFRFTHLIMTFKTFRPAAMFIERSSDFGRTWSVYRYFAYDCDHSFPHVKEERPRNHNDVICTSAYSAVSPSNGGELVYKVISPQIKTGNPYAEDLTNLLKMTNLRINFTKLHTLGDDLLDYRPEIHDKYYYALYELVVRGSCSCYGHAQRCIAIGDEGVGYDSSDMVHGRCECTHNTKGLNCEKCDDFFNDLPWRPAIGNMTNECRRCECNNHAYACHFDKAVYQASGFVSGGVCDSCQHNTMGKHCEQCKPFFYKDKDLPMTDHGVCHACQCDKTGSLNNGICESEEDPERNLVAGKCYCKENVDSPRCDRCKNGFWNLDKEDPLGCKACTCNILGTYNNEGCDKDNGACNCKRLVTGENCDECLEDHYGLSEDINGCKACDCDIGGSLDTKCDSVSGQCKCRPHFSGRRCETTDSSFYCANIDHYTYEAENALTSGVESELEPRATSKSNYHKTWSGTGFMRVKEGSKLIFVADGVAKSMDYSVIIRYETEKENLGWERIQVLVKRPESVDPYGPCSNSNPNDDFLYINLHPNGRYAEVRPSICMEAGKPYEFTLVIGERRVNYPDRSATLLIDSISLVPPTNQFEIFQGEGVNGLNARNLDEYNRYQCRSQAILLTPFEQLSDQCKKYICPVAAMLLEAGQQCDCDATGSISGICRSQGGQCECKPNVVGRRCDQCAEGTFGFGPAGCIRCECDSVGSLNNFCHKQTGQCLCSGNGITGRQCNQCHPGFWKFPECQSCECNEHAAVCDQKSGACIECRELTDGQNCERCLAGYYGDPRLTVNIPCKPCRCPSGPGSGSQHADSCFVRSSLDYATQDFLCNCKAGYKGKNCDTCDVNHWGNPREVGGSCEKCDCNGNINTNDVGNCDSENGDCLKCLFHTEGAQCEHCQDGYHGEAKTRNCQKCTCNYYGTNSTQSVCNKVSGQCPCLPNVTGKNCDMCEPNHYNLQSAKGCDACGCDPTGVVNSYDGTPNLECNGFNGQCQCKQGRGGRTCSDCQNYYWGNPIIGECAQCQCNSHGSAEMQCNRNDGTCICKPGSGGPLCNTCARGYTGVWPNCKTCGECFQNWDNILQKLRLELDVLLDKANNIEDSGIASEYDEEFNEMETKVAEINEQLTASEMSPLDIKLLNENIVQMQEKIGKAQGRHNFAAEIVTKTANDAANAAAQTALLKDEFEEIQHHANEYSDKATELREKDILGAYNVTKESAEKSQSAKRKSENAISTFAEAESKSLETEQLLASHNNDFVKQHEANTAALEKVQQDYQSLVSVVPKINLKVCGKEAAPCDALCGGPIAQCGSCGGKSCPEGAVSKADQAQEFINEAFNTLQEKQKDAEALLYELRKAQEEFIQPVETANQVYSFAEEEAAKVNNTIHQVSELIQEIDAFINADRSTPDQIKAISGEILDLKISQTQEEIESLSNEIRERLSKIDNVNKILSETRGNKTIAVNLQNSAENARKKAEQIANVRTTVRENLKNTTEYQEKANSAYTDAKEKLAEAKENYEVASKEAKEAELILANSTKAFKELNEEWTAIGVQYLQTAELRKTANKDESSAKEKIQWATSTYDSLTDNIELAKNKLSERKSGNQEPQQRAENLRKRATDLLAKRLNQNTETEELTKKIAVSDTNLGDMSHAILEQTEKIEETTIKIKNLEDHYAHCDI